MAASAQATSPHYDTIVIGAGMSGLSCAARLYRHKRFQKKNALAVLEGRDRIGGRIGAVNVNGCRLDTGANWIHGIGTEEDPNPLVKILPHKKYRELGTRVAFRAPEVDGSGEHAAGRETSPPDREWVEVSGVGPPSQSVPGQPVGDLVVPGEMAEGLTGAVWGMMGSLHEVAARTSEQKAKKTTMLKAVTETREFKQGFKRLSKEYHRTFSCMPQFLEGVEAAPLVAQSAEHPEGQPGMSLQEFKIDDFDGEQVFLQDGYIAVIDEVARDLMKDGIVHCGVKVMQIQWDTKPMIVHTSQGKYSADEIVCSLPLGVLKQDRCWRGEKSVLFYPPLPADKTEAVDRLGFGTLDKIFSVYDRPWWNEEPYISILRKGMPKETPQHCDSDGQSRDPKQESPTDSFMGFTNELPGFTINKDGTVSTGPRTLFMINLHSLTGFPVLSCFTSCSNATQIEAMSDAQAAGIIHRAVTMWFGIAPPKPAAVHVTRWAQDEFSRGSYSHMITGLTEKRHRGAFQEPVRNRHGCVLRFAGEHTSMNHFATVHGALLSGWREADGILDRKENARA